MRKANLTLKTCVLLGCTLFLFSCKKDESSSTKTLTSDEKFALASKQFMSLLEIGTSSGSQTQTANSLVKGAKKVLSDDYSEPFTCHTYTMNYDSIGTTKVMKFTDSYGSGCTGLNSSGKSETRKGSMTMEASYSESLQIMKMIYDDYTMEGEVQNGFRISTTTVNNNKSINTSKTSLTSIYGTEKLIIDMESTVEYTNGDENTGSSLLSMNMNGSAQGTIEGSAVSAKYNNFYIDGTCNKATPTKGSIEISSAELSGVVDCGDGTCDNIGTLTIDGITKKIDLETGEIIQ